MDFAACGLISLTTDFGLRDPFVGCMKGVIACNDARLRVTDLCHEIPAQDISAAGFWLSRTYRYFPIGSVHLAIVDPGVGSDRGLVLVTLGGHCFVAPDNGLLAPLYAVSGASVRRVASTVINSLALSPRSTTFAGRDVFAPLAAALASGMLVPGDAGDLIDDAVPGDLNALVLSPHQTQGSVLVVDRFGNLITNLEAQVLGDPDGLQVWIEGQCLAICNTYSDVSEGGLCALINAWGVLEIACRNGSAAQQLGVAAGAIVQVIRS